MFLLLGISSAEKKLDFVQTILCSRCGMFGRFEVIMTYTFLSLFFIPTFHWNKKYYVKSSCCNTLYELDPSLGKRIQKGEKIELSEKDLHVVNQFSHQESGKICGNCGYLAAADFEFCPKCGKHL